MNKEKANNLALIEKIEEKTGLENLTSTAVNTWPLIIALALLERIEALEEQVDSCDVGPVAKLDIRL